MITDNERKIIEELNVVEIEYNEIYSTLKNNRYEVLFNIGIQLSDKTGKKLNKKSVKHPIIYITSKYNLLGSYNLNLN
jgi:hypothetical protein